jgi:hypothetical protein
MRTACSSALRPPCATAPAGAHTERSMRAVRSSKKCMPSTACAPARQAACQVGTCEEQQHHSPMGVCRLYIMQEEKSRQQIYGVSHERAVRWRLFCATPCLPIPRSCSRVGETLNGISSGKQMLLWKPCRRRT